MRCLALLLLCATPALANVPAAYLACDGKAEGDPCRLVGPAYGACVLDTLCEDTPEVEANECLLCVDPCWGLPSGEACQRTIDNSPGVCELQDRCTDKAETSFTECNRCVDGSVAPGDGGDDGGCALSPRGGGLAVIWAFIMLGAVRQGRRELRRR